MTLQKFRGVLLLAAGVLAGAGCSAPSFERKWNEATAAGIPASGIEGPWTGRWKSDVSGHTGELRCIVDAPEDAEAPWDFHYWFTWENFEGSYSVAYGVREEKGVYRFSGDADLGILGGVYRHEGTATREKFEANYRSDRDQGSFSMMRPAASTTPTAASRGSSSGGTRRYRRTRR